MKQYLTSYLFIPLLITMCINLLTSSGNTPFGSSLVLALEAPSTPPKSAIFNTLPTASTAISGDEPRGYMENSKETSNYKKVFHRIYLTMGPQDLSNYKAEAKPYNSTETATFRTENISIKDPKEKSSSQTFEVSFKTRGQTSIAAPRRNFQIEQVKVTENTKIDVSGSGKQGKMSVGKVKGKKIVLTSMWQDEGYISSQIGFRMAQLIGIPEHKIEYAELFINGNSNGLYLISKKVPDEAIQDLNSPLVIRRRYMSGYEVAKYDEQAFPSAKDVTDPSLSPIVSQYADLVNITKSDSISVDSSGKLMRILSGSKSSMMDEFIEGLPSMVSDGKDINGGLELYNELSKRMNLQGYFSWMAQNFLLMNGDYSDEVFFYSVKNPPEGKNPVYFDVLPWDFDDLFKPAMHWAPLNMILAETTTPQISLIYNFEDALDRKIYKDPYLHSQYLQNTKQLLTDVLNEKAIKEIIAETKREIEPYLESPTVLSMSQMDSVNGGVAYTKSSILELLQKRESQLLNRRNQMLCVLDKKESQLVECFASAK